MGSENKLVILESEKAQEIYQPLLQQFTENNWVIKFDHEITNTELSEADLLILGLDQQASRNLFGATTHALQGFTLDVRHNPLNPKHVAVLVSSSSTNETDSVASRLRHYGKYSFLSFEKGRAIKRTIPESDSGIGYQLEQLPAGAPTHSLSAFDNIVQELHEFDVIYIGENHTSVSDHRLQLRLLEALSEQIHNLSIGMEMFPESSQKALDTYVMSDTGMTEKDFLKDSHYYKVWQYDFRYFREIFHLAREKKIPVIGLNLERNTVSTVYKTGTTDDLPIEIQNSLPQERNLDMEGYGDRLRAMHALHEEGGHGSGQASGFIQAQAIWDETMAENIAHYLKNHPGRKMIVLAGNQHTRKDSGIPPRVARRTAVNQATVLNIAEGAPQNNLKEIADYIFFSEPMSISQSSKIGVMLEERKENTDGYIEIIDFSPESKAPEAGLQKGDIIRFLADYPITAMEDIRIAMLDSQNNKNVRVVVERLDGSEKIHVEVSVPLMQASPKKPHP